MSFVSDILPAFQKHRLIFEGKRKETGNIMSFVFRPEKPLNWKPGQHGILSFGRARLEGGSWRGFSIASAPYEGVVMISTRIPERPSAYKQALMNLEPGDAITMRGPFGPFYIDDPSRPVVFIAGGIGITPYRSMILSLLKNNRKGTGTIRLLYADDKKEYAYTDELGTAVATEGFVEINYMGSREELSDEIAKAVNEYGNSASYFISGPGSMIKAVKHKLKDYGIGKRNIKYEPFFGL